MNQDTEKLGIGLVGIGKMAHRHARAFMGIENSRLVAVYSQSLDRAQEFARQYGIEGYNNLENFLANPEVQVVAITTIHSQHAAIGIKAAQAGKHIIVEKPMDASLEKAKALVRECQKNKVYLATLFQHRFDGVARKLKKIIEDGKLGEIFLASVKMRWPRGDDYFAGAGGWRGRKSQAGGGVLINQAIHLIDCLLWLVDQDVASVYGETQIVSHDVEVEDTGVALIRFKNNALAVVEATISVSERLPNEIEIHGTKGSAIIKGEILTVLTKDKTLFEKVKDKIWSQIFHRLPFIFDLKIKNQVGNHQENLAAIIQAIQNSNLPPVSDEQGLKSLEVVEAIYTSSQEKRLVKLRDVEPKSCLDRNKYYQKILEENKQEPIQVLLVNPLNVTLVNRQFSHIGKHRLRPPLCLAYTAAFLKKITKARLVDAAVLGWPIEKVVNFINEIKPKILVLSSTPLDRWQNPDLDIANIFKIINQSKVKNIILIGAHGTVSPDWVFENCKVNFIVRGEPELTCLELVEKILKDEQNLCSIQGLSFRQMEKVIYNPDRIFKSNLDEYPWPAYEDLPMDLYSYTTKDLPQSFSIMLTSRGCPYNCIFCLKAMMPSKYRFRSAENIFEEIKYLKENFKIRSVYFQDWEFLIHKERVRKLCQKMIDEKIGLVWGCSVRANDLDEEIVSLMRQAGCVLINFGYESGAAEILEQSKKGVSLDQMSQAVKLCQDENINLRSFCLVNLPGETKKTLKESAKFMIQNNLNVPDINIPIPYPSTELAQRIACDSWQKAMESAGKVENVLDPLQAKKILKKYIWQARYSRFYFLNPKFCWHIMSIIKRRIL